MTFISRRAWLTLSLSAFIGAGLAGCGGGSNGPAVSPTPTSAPTPAPVPNAGPTFSTGKIVYLNEPTSESAAIRPFARAITLLSPDGTKRAIMRPDAPNALVSSPSLSPSGNRIAFVSQSDKGSDLYVINTDGSGVKRLTASGQVAPYGLPQWTPDGSQIFFILDGPLSALGKGIGFVSVNGGVPHTYIGSGDDLIGDIAISPDGSNLAYLTSTLNSSNSSARFSQVYVQSLTSNAPARRLTMRTVDKLSVTFSPDGQRLAFSANNIPALSIINLDGTGERVLTADQDVTLDVTWSPDGQTLAYSNGSKINLIRADGQGETRPLPFSDGASRQFAPSWGR